MDIKLRKIDIAKLTGIKPRTILDWTQKGYLVPEGLCGQGVIRHYTPIHAVQAKILKLLSDVSIRAKKLTTLFAPGNTDIFDPFKNTGSSIVVVSEVINDINIKIEMDIKKIKAEIADSLEKSKKYITI